MTKTPREPAFASGRLVKGSRRQFQCSVCKGVEQVGSGGRQKSCGSSIISDRFDLTNTKSSRTIPVCLPINIQRTEIRGWLNSSTRVKKSWIARMKMILTGTTWSSSEATYTNLVWGKLSIHYLHRMSALNHDQAYSPKQ